MPRALAIATVIATMASVATAQERPPSDGWVVISIDDYRALRLKAYPPEPPPLPPPVPMSLTKIEYDLRAAAGGDSVEGEVRFTVDVLRDGWVTLQIPAGYLARGARVEGRPVPIVNDGAGVLLSKRGRSVVTLDVVIPLKVGGGSESLTLPTAGAGITRAALVVPRREIDLSVSGGVLADRPADPEKPWIAYASTIHPLTMTWSRRVEDPRRAEATRIRGSVTETVGLSEETGIVTASVGVEVTQGIAQAVSLGFPEGLIVNQVVGPLVGEWEFKPGTLRVAFLEPLSAQTTFVVMAEAAVPREGSISVPLVRLTGAERETGAVAVEVLGAGEISDREPRGLDPGDPSDLGGALSPGATPSTVAFRYRPQDASAPRSLSINVRRYTPQAVLVASVEEARYDLLAGEEGKLLVRARYAVRNNQRGFLAVRLPEGATLWSTAVASRPLRPGAGPDGGLLIPLLKGRSGEDTPPFVVEVAYVQRVSSWSDDGRSSVTLPTLDLPVSRTGVALHYSPRFKLEPEPGAFREESDTGPFSEALRVGDTPAREMMRIGGLAGGVVGGLVEGLPDAPPAPAAPTQSTGAPTKSADTLIEEFRRKSAGRSVAGVVPVRVVFPRFGSILFLASELTPEGQAPVFTFSYERESRW